MQNYARIMITLSTQEYLALVSSAKQEKRPPRDHIRVLLSQALDEQGFLPTNANSDAITGQGTRVAVAD